MTQRRLLLALGAMLVVVGAVWWLMPRPGATEANCARIKQGMREAEVEAILGGPPSLYAAVDPASGAVLGRNQPFPAKAYGRGAWWEGDEGIVMVRFQDDGRVLGADFARKGDPTLLERMRRLLP